MVYRQPPSDPLNMEFIPKEIFDGNGDTINGSYDVWLKNHPSALSSFDEIKRVAHEKQMVVFLDYDGTLSPIVNDPDRAFMSNAMRSAVRKVGKHFPTAIVSGRSRDKVFQFVRLNNIYYAGSHGMDISTPSVSLYYGNHKHQTRTIDEKGNEMVNFCPAQKFLPRIQTIKVMLQEITRGIKGAMVEDNKFCLSVHFRCVNEDEKVDSAMKCYKDFHISEGKEVMEIRPNINWDKGLALQYILDNLGFENSSKVLPIYIGDDKTDEDAFKMIKSIGRGFPIVVSSTPKETEALYSLHYPIEVMSFLIRLAKWKKDCTLRGGYKKKSLFGVFRRLIR
ncbi:putative trehalose-phosphate phosphatase 3 [Castanea sativa]|uniref:putative trehalose-phosphate phosphatase 3 n=1 Tax=Castanea sativa TaxID=21020 RepID=UPI003F649C05